MIRFVTIFTTITMLFSALFSFFPSTPRRLGCFGDYTFIEDYYLNPMIENPSAWVIASSVVLAFLIVMLNWDEINQLFKKSKASTTDNMDLR